MGMGVSQIFFRADVNEIVSSLPQFAGTYYFKEELDPRDLPDPESDRYMWPRSA
jgi:hypothetical protein